MPKIASLITTLGLDSSSFVSGMDKARAKSRQTTTGIRGDIERMGNTFKALNAAVAGFATGFVIEGLSQAISQGLEYASSLGEVAQQLGVTTKTLQEYRFAATQTGISQEQMDQGLARLTKSLGEAEAGNKPLIAAFRELGVTARSTDEALPQIIAGLSAIPEPAKRAALETTIFGKAGQKLDTLLAGGVSQVDNLKNAAQRLGIVLSDEQIQRADDTADKLAAVQMVLKARIAGEVADNADAIFKLADALVTAGGAAIDAAAKVATFWSRIGAVTKAGGGGFLNMGVGFAAAAFGMSADEQAARNKRVSAIMNDKDLSWIAKERGGTTPTRAPRLSAGGGGGGGSRRSRGGGGGRSGSGKTEKPLAEQAHDVLESLFPSEAQAARLEKEYELLGKALLAGALPKDEYDKAVDEIRTKINELRLGPAVEHLNDASATTSEFQKALVEGLTPAIEKSKELKDSFADTARGVLASLDDMVRGFKSGDLIGGLQGVLNLLLQLGGTGLFGKKIATSINSAPDRRASGGPLSPWRATLVGERGPEMIVPTTGGTVIPNHALRGANDNRGSISFDLRGAVMTEHLLMQMEGIAASTSGRMIGARAKQQRYAQTRRVG